MPTASEMNSTITKIKAMQSKWGITQTTKTFTAGNKITSKDTNELIDMVIAGKTKSGWTGTVSSKVSVGQIISNIAAALSTQADSITTHCPCNCNYCSCNCNHCSCNCNRCQSCGSSCDSGCDSAGSDR